MKLLGYIIVAFVFLVLFVVLPFISGGWLSVIETLIAACAGVVIATSLIVGFYLIMEGE